MNRILTLLERTKCAGRDWFAARAQGSYARAWLAFIAFSESSFFLVPSDVLLIAILMVNAKRWLYYALFTTFWSVAGGVFGYLVGAFFYDTVGQPLIAFYGIAEEVAYVQRLFDGNVLWVMAVAAFAPVPYKAFVLGGGFLGVDLLMFIVGSAVGRVLRFTLVAYLTKMFGGVMAALLFRYFNYVTFAALAVLLLVALELLGVIDLL